MDDRSDGSLIEAWRRGETEAFEGLLARHQGPLLRHAQALLGAWRGGEDAVQDAFLRLAETPPKLPARARGDAAAERAIVASWLHRVVRNRCLDAMRSEKRRRKREEASALIEASAGGLDAVEAADTRAAVERGLARLPADQREALVLRLFGERSYREIASITGKKVGTVGWLISVGLKTLSAELAPLASGIGSSDAQAPRLQEGLS